jgi:hypothetical protein
MPRERGFILPMVIFSLAIMGVLVMVLVSTSDDDRLGSRYDLEGTRSFNAAEAGLADILTDWKADGYEGTVPLVGSSNVLPWRTLANNGGRYRGTILKVDNSSYLITVDGQSAGARKGLRTIQMMLTPVSLGYSVLGGTNVTFTKGNTDSWDSDAGTYAATKCDPLVAGSCSGDIWSNGTITLSGTALIHGDAAAVGAISGGCPSPWVDGSCTSPAAPAPMPPISCPAPYSPAADVHLAAAGATYSSATGDFTVGKANGVGGNIDTLQYGNTPYVFHNVTMGGASILYFDGTPQHVDIYISGTLDLGGGIISNPSGKPTNLSIWGCGTSTTTWTLSGGPNGTSEAYFAVYAPKHPITISGGGELFGAVVGASVNNSGGSQIHYDLALARVPSLVLVPGSWTEITR